MFCQCTAALLGRCSVWRSFHSQWQRTSPETSILPQMFEPSKHTRFSWHDSVWLSDSVYMPLKDFWHVEDVACRFSSRFHCLVLSELCLRFRYSVCRLLCPVVLSVLFFLCPSLFFSLVFLFYSACPSRATRLIGLCFRLNERSMEAGWRINSRICNKQSQLALPLMLSLSVLLSFSLTALHRRERSVMSFCLLASSSLLSCMHVLLHCHQKHKNKHLFARISHSFEKILHRFCVPPLCGRNLDTTGFSFPISSVLVFKPIPTHAQLIVFW